MRLYQPLNNPQLQLRGHGSTAPLRIREPVSPLRRRRGSYTWTWTFHALDKILKTYQARKRTTLECPGGHLVCRDSTACLRAAARGQPARLHEGPSGALRGDPGRVQARQKFIDPKDRIRHLPPLGASIHKWTLWVQAQGDWQVAREAAILKASGI